MKKQKLNRLYGSLCGVRQELAPLQAFRILFRTHIGVKNNSINARRDRLHSWHPNSPLGMQGRMEQGGQEKPGANPPSAMWQEPTNDATYVF